MKISVILPSGNIDIVEIPEQQEVSGSAIFQLIAAQVGISANGNQICKL
jgi:hypothetical protein